jgi:excisionase family DNA binding protein
MSVPVGRGRLLTIREVAAQLRVSQRTVERLLAKGELPALQVGSHPRAPVRIDEAELEEWLYGDPGAAA